ncbi:MAG: DUF3800 domain-containing protein [Candidatus Liptonbacteria bacterium]|nr:DUF3800 domain-containing protein [Candidatus Liptonbacteria bacterium]
MVHIFLDESGDSGFNFAKKRTTKYFLITALFVAHKGPVEKIVRKVRRALAGRERKRHVGVLHAHYESPKVRTQTLSLLAEKDVSILCIYLNKRRVYTNLQAEQDVLYNYVTNILLDRIYRKKLLPVNEPITLVASRRQTNKFLNENFKWYLAQQTERNHALRLTAEIKSTREEASLQIVDFASWAIFRKYEYGDDTYYNLIRQKIVEENPLFP